MSANIEEALRSAMTGATNEVRNTALASINLWLAANPNEFVNGLAGILSTPNKDAAIQQLACTQLKQIFTVKGNDQTVAENNWWAMSDQTRVNVKNALFNALQIPGVGMVAAVAIAPIALIELKRGSWMDLIQAFQKVGMSVEFPPSMVVATLACMGFLVDQASLSAKNILTPDVVNSLLTVFVFRMAPMQGADPKSAESINIRSRATEGMYHLIDYTSQNFSNESERYMIIKSVIENAKIQVDPLIKKFAFRCLERVVRKQYSYLSCKIPTDLNNAANGLSEIIELILTVTINQVDYVTSTAMNTGEFFYGGEPEGDCAVDAVNVWRSLATYEYELPYRIQMQGNGNNSLQCNNYIQKALTTLVPKLLMSMCTQADNQDPEALVLSSIAGVALRECARTVGGPIVQLIMQFVNSNVSSDNWRLADTSCLAFGIVVEFGREFADTYVPDASKFFIEKSLRHQVLVVRESAAWVLGMICRFKFNVLGTANLIAPMIQAFSNSFSDDTRVVANICTAIYNLAESAYIYTLQSGSGSDEHVLAPITKDIIVALLNTLQRQDADSQNFLSCVYECINKLVDVAPASLMPMLEDLLVQISTNINMTVQKIMDANSSGISGSRLLLEISLSLLCGVLNTIMARIACFSRDTILKYNANISQLLIGRIIFSNIVSSNVMVIEEAILALDTLIMCVGSDCYNYISDAMNIAIEVLKHPEHNETFGVGLGLAGDIITIVGDEIYDKLDSEKGLAFQALMDTTLQLVQRGITAFKTNSIQMIHFAHTGLINILPQFITVKSQTLLARYLQPVIQCLIDLTGICQNYKMDEDDDLFNEEDYDVTERNNGEFETNHSKIQFSILTAWSCVVGCVIDHRDILDDKFLPIIPGILGFVQSCYNNGKCSGRNILNCLSLVSDLVYYNPQYVGPELAKFTWFKPMAMAARNLSVGTKDEQSIGYCLGVLSKNNLL